MIIRVDKCSTFGIRKAITKSVQYLPKLLINNQLIPTINIGESFQYLGRFFDFNMSNDKHKSELTTLVDDLMSDIDSKPLHPKNKLLLYNHYVLSKLSWHFTVATLSKTWVIENVDSLVKQYIRKWLEIPISGTLSTVFMTKNNFGLSIYPPSVKFTQCQVVLRRALKLSPNESINELWKSTNTHTNVPSWIPKLSDPVFQFDLDPPTYQQITNIIRKMKSSGSPCPLDQLSIICFKRCPYLRSYLTELIHETWRSGTVPTVWKRACTILIHKKGHTDDPSNFRPITLESVPLKVFTSCLRNAIYSFLTCNNFIEQNIQKGFTPNLSGTLEHTAQMADINKARIRQRSVVITLLDLKHGAKC